MKYISRIFGVVSGVVIVLIYITAQTEIETEPMSLVILMFLSIFFLAWSASMGDASEDNQVHISTQLTETYHMAERAERTASRLLEAIISMQELYNEQLMRVTTGHDNSYEYEQSTEDGGSKGNTTGNGRGHGREGECC